MLKYPQPFQMHKTATSWKIKGSCKKGVLWFHQSKIIWTLKYKASRFRRGNSLPFSKFVLTNHRGRPIQSCAKGMASHLNMKFVHGGSLLPPKPHTQQALGMKFKYVISVNIIIIVPALKCSYNIISWVKNFVSVFLKIQTKHTWYWIRKSLSKPDLIYQRTRISALQMIIFKKKKIYLQHSWALYICFV